MNGLKSPEYLNWQDLKSLESDKRSWGIINNNNSLDYIVLFSALKALYIEGGS